MDIKNLTQEQAEKMKELKTPEEILAFVQDEGVELTDEQLEAVAGGEKSWDGKNICPACGSTNTTPFGTQHDDYFYVAYYQCYACGNQWGWEDYAPATPV